jgi:hypothetical protein
VLARKLELVFYDDESDPVSAVRLYEKLMLLFQWQDGQKVIVWPEELAPGKPRFPTPPWSQRP